MQNGPCPAYPGTGWSDIVVQVTKRKKPTDFYGNLVYKFIKIIGKNDLSYHFKKIIVLYKKIGYNIGVLRQTAYLVVNPIKVHSFAYLCNCTRVGQTSD